MLKTMECPQVAQLVCPYLDETLGAGEKAAFENHVRGCRKCQTELNRITKVRNLLKGSMGAVALSPDFAAETGRRLKAVTTGPVPATIGEEDEEEVLAPAPAGFLDSLAARFGAAPWWIISGAFHGLLITLLFLIGLAIMQVKKNDTVILTSLEKQKEKEPEKEQPPRDILKNPTPIETEQVNPQPEVIVHEEVEVSDHFETDDNMNQQDAFGDEGISDIPLGGSGFSGAIGVGGGAAGAFGRPLGGGSQRLRRAEAGGGGQKTESAVDKGLEWLAKHQEADGHWDAAKYGGQKCDTAMTGMALLAFLGAGHTEKVGKYKDNVARAVDYLIKHQKDNGCLAQQGESTGYNHAMAGMALAEASAMGRVARTKEAAQKVIDYAVEIHQAGEGSEKRGYRYKPKQDPADLSNHGWFVMLVKSAKVAGLNIPNGGIEGAIWFLDQVEDKNFAKDAANDYDNGRHRYGYANAQSVTFRRTAIGCLNRQFMGTPAEELQGGVDWFVKTGGIPGQREVDLYYWYYGTLCTFQQGGEVWKKWNEGLKGALLPAQRVGGDEDGSWDPAGKYSTHWGRVGQTAISVLCLEVYYRYLPMYR